MSESSPFQKEAKIKERGVNYAWIVLSACFIIGVVSYGTRGSFSLFFTSIEHEFGLNRTTTSLISSTSQIFSCIVAVIGGWVLDRYGPRKALTGAAIISGIGLILTSRATTLWQVYVGYSFLVALGTGAVNSMIMAVVSKWFVRRRALALGITGSSLSLSSMLAPVVSYLIVHYSWQSAYLILGMVALLFWLPSALLVKNIPKANNTASMPDTDTPEKSDGLTLSQALKNRQFWLFFSIWLLHAIGMLIVFIHIIPHAMDMGISVESASFILIINGISSLAGRLIMGRYADVFNKKLIFAVCTSFMALSVLWLIWASNLWMLYLFAVVWGFSFGGGDPTSMAIVVDIFGIRRLGTIFGALDTGFNIGAAAGPAIAGYIFDVRGSYSLAFLVGAILIGISVWLILAVKSPEHKVKVGLAEGG